MCLVENAVANVIVQRVKHLRGLPHNTAGLSCDWREQTLEANALDLQFALHDWTVRVGNRAERCRNGSDEALHLRCREPQAGFVHSFTVGFEPDTAVFIDDDLRDLRIAYGSQNSRPELSSEEFVQASLLKLLCHDHADSPLLLARLSAPAPSLPFVSASPRPRLAIHDGVAGQKRGPACVVLPVFQASGSACSARTDRSSRAA